MDAQRQGEIALLLIKRQLRKKGPRLSPDFRREIGQEAAQIGISTQELVDFVEPIFREMVEEMFSKTA